jgi:hypothetical protein
MARTVRPRSGGWVPRSHRGGGAEDGADSPADASGDGLEVGHRGSHAGLRSGSSSTPSRARSIAGRWRERILPRSLLGITSLILAFSIGAGLSGVVLYSYYQYRLDQTNSGVNALVSGYKQAFANAEKDLAAEAAAAKSQVQSATQALQQLQTDPAGIAKLVKQLAPSVFFVHTLDQAGQPSVGTAFVIASTSDQSLLLTSYTVVAAATHSPAPAVYVQQGSGSSTQVTVRSWDPTHDLALLVLAQGGLRAVSIAPSSSALQPGERLFAVSGSGSAGASVTAGTVVDTFSGGIAEDAPVGPAFQGGPLVNSNGQVVAVASRNYSPLGFASSGVYYAPYLQAACDVVLSCPGGRLG